MTNYFLSITAATFVFVLAQSCVQILAQSPTHTESCGTTQQEGELIKQRLLSNRLHISPAQIREFKQQRTIKYIPITFHLVGTDDALTYPTPAGAVACVCALNQDFASQNIQFYIQYPILYMNDVGLYNDGWLWSSQTAMRDAKVANTMNIYIGTGTSQPVAGYYSGGGNDFIWLKRDYASAASNVLTHESGHFYTLPHTFYGWEGINYDDTYHAQPSPINVGGDPVEYKTRTGVHANCQTAADGFCDTEADYYSSREDCSYNSVVLDPDSVRLTPDNTLYMSYFGDGCMVRFSPEQEDAMAADILQRGWTNFPAPSLLPVTNDSIRAITPTQNEILAPVGNADLTLEWNPAPNATAYIVYIDRYFSGVFLQHTYATVVYGTNSLTIPYSTFSHVGAYRWSVIPFSSYSTCSSFSVSFDFTLANLTGVNKTMSNTSGVLFEIAPNPIQHETLTLNLVATLNTYSSIQIYSTDGRLVLQSKEYLNSGNNTYTIPVQHLASGTYIVSVTTERGVLQKRFVKP